MNIKWLRIATILIISIVISVFFIFRIDAVFAAVAQFFGYLRPFWIGIVVAFVLNKPYLRMRRFFGKLFKKDEHGKTVVVSAVLTVYILFSACVVAVCFYIIPQLVNSVTQFVNNIDGYYQNVRSFFDAHTSFTDSTIWKELGIEQKLQDFSQTLPNALEGTFTHVYRFTSGFVRITADSLLGFIISLYLLLDKRKWKEQLKKILRITFPDKTYQKIVEFLRLASRTFSSFIGGQVTDTVSLGALGFLGMTILRLEYPVLISTVVAVTNLIPIIGPFIGSIPSILLLLLTNPIHALWFAIFILILQQVEANLIYPRIVGNSVGLPTLWVLFAVVLGGSYFGIVGMILGIPVMSVLYELASGWINDRYQRLNGDREEEDNSAVSD